MKSILFILALILGGSLALALDAKAQPIVTESTSKSTTKVESPPPSAIAPAITSINNDLCTTGVAGAVQTQILGISSGFTVRDLNCEMIKLSKYLYDMGMRTAAVTLMCQDFRVWKAMHNSGTYCPIDGKIGLEAKELWEKHPEKIPKPEQIGGKDNDTAKGFGWGIGFSLLLALLLL
jgi:hypothetical protein